MTILHLRKADKWKNDALLGRHSVCKTQALEIFPLVTSHALLDKYSTGRCLPDKDVDWLKKIILFSSSSCGSTVKQKTTMNGNSFANK